ncbi:PAS-domain containing protein [Brucellaceae bacterium C25G]
MQGWTIIGLAFLYLLFLFAIASIGDKRKSNKAVTPRPYIFALSLAVYCTSWTFFGSVGIASTNGLEFLGIYIGPILVFIFGNRFLRHIVRLAKSEHVTSIADFLATRYGKSFSVASLATLIAAVGSIPYISLQLKAVSGSVDMIVTNYNPDFDPSVFILGDISLAVAAVLALFAILFGTRHTDATEHQNGLILAVAVESLIKLSAFLVVGIAVTFFLFGSPAQLLNELYHSSALSALEHKTSTSTWIIHTLLSACAIIMLPRQFHVTVVENRSEKELYTARWLFPLYLILINVFVLPIALIGVMKLGTSVHADLYVLALPLQANADFIAIVAFIGGLSAATAMVIVACVALSIMISNHLVLPLLIKYFLRQQNRQKRDLTRLILITRRLTIIVILGISFIYYRATSYNADLASIGFISFAAIAQFAPPLIGGLSWRNANERGALLGLSAGFIVWAYTLLIPTLAPDNAALLIEGPFGIAWLRPNALFGIDTTPLTHGVIWSLLINTCFFIGGSLSRAATPIERIQASIFLPRHVITMPTLRRFRTEVTVAELQTTISSYLGSERVARALTHYENKHQEHLEAHKVVDINLLRYAEQLLGTAVGSSSARLILSLLLHRKDGSARGARQLLDNASEALQQNRDLLQIAIDQMPQGVTVLDKDLRLTCWNRQFRQLLNLPDEVIQVGFPISTILEYLDQRGDMPVSERAAIIRSFGRSNQAWRFQIHSTGKTLEIRSNPMPDGGLVASYTDVTESVEADAIRQRDNAILEQRVADRTAELMAVNQELARAQGLAEQANLGKTRFLAAVGHDILQPLNAARLYSTLLSEKLIHSEYSEFAENINSSLESVEAILGLVLDISRLDTGALKPEPSVFRLDILMQQVANDFTPLAKSRRLELRVVPSSIIVKTDRNMLRRLLQNLISNAIKYSHTGKILFGVRRRGKHIDLQVLDSGIGIASDKLSVVFQEFTRLDEGARVAEGLGLGLSIVARIGQVLDLPVSLTSIVGRGSVFTIGLTPSPDPIEPDQQTAQQTNYVVNSLQNTRVLCLDNDAKILGGMQALLGNWGCHVESIRNHSDLIFYCHQSKQPPHIIVADYHLEEGNGLEIIDYARKYFAKNMNCHFIPAILLTADRSPEVRMQADERQIIILNKPLKPAALRALLSKFAPRS